VVVLVVLAASMSALFGRLGDRLRRPDVVQFAGMMIMMPLMFVSAAFAPLASMPGWLQTLAAVNPVAYAIDALRGAVLGTGTLADIGIALATAAVLWLLVTAVSDTTRRRRATRAGGVEGRVS
jgi:ABC-2 type transport system permease protein